MLDLNQSLLTIKTYLKTYYNMSNPTIDDLNAELFHDFFLNDTLRLVATYMGNDFNYTDLSSERMRSIFPFAFPLQGYKNKADRKKEQEDKLGKWQLEFLKDVDPFTKQAPYGVRAYNGFPFALNYQISDLILQQVWWLVGSFTFLFVFAVIVQKSFFTSLLGVFGVFMPIPCAVCTLKFMFHILYIDVINVIGLFLICGIGADCVFILFELFRQGKLFYQNDNRLRLAYAGQKGVIALSTSISTSAVSFLALLSSGVRIMNFFGVFCFLLLMYTFIFSFTWYLSILAIFAKYIESKPLTENPHNSFSTSQNNEEESPDYPHTNLFDFLHHWPTFNIDIAKLPIDSFNFYEKNCLS